jgi:hypothetical protein
MNVGYTNSFSIRFFVNIYDTVHMVLIKIHIVFTIAYNTCIELAEDFFFSEIGSLRMEHYTLFLGETPPSPPPKKNLPQQHNPYIGLFVQNFNINIV